MSDLLALLAAWGSCGSGTGVCTLCLETMDPSLASTQFPWLLGFGGQNGPVSDTWTETIPIEIGLRLAADEFEPLQNGLVSTVNWWGFYEQAGANCDSGYVDSFTITYYNAALHSGTGQLVPGSVIATFTDVTNGSIFAKMDTGETVGNGIPVYFYTADHAPVFVTQDTTYFVEIRNTDGDITGASGCHWRWAWSADGTLLYSAQKPEGYSSYLSSSNPDNAMNLAFGLDIEIHQMELIPPPLPPPPPPPGGEEDPPGGGGFGKGG